VNELLLHCSANLAENSGFFAVFFLGGLTGGFTHCLPMCGPLAACHTLCGKAKCDSRLARAQQVLGLPYHLGRLTTYTALGFVAALLSRQVAAAPYWPLLSSTMLAVAGVMFVVSSLSQSPHSFFSVSARSTYLRGALMGFMPCGLLYAALMMAATLAHPLLGALAMALFALGILLPLTLATASADYIRQRWQGAMTQAGRALMAGNGLFLLVMAGQIMR
jgi:uncharacterized protein